MNTKPYLISTVGALNSLVGYSELCVLTKTLYTNPRLSTLLYKSDLKLEWQVCRKQCNGVGGKSSAADNPLHNPCVYQLVTTAEELPVTIQNHMNYNTCVATSFSRHARSAICKSFSIRESVYT